MKLQLKLLKPNPFRDLKIDPIDQDARAMLRQSIKEHTFWSGTVARKNGSGSYEVAAGWTRILAAMDEKIEEAEICVVKYDDQQMIRAYITENATQRGNSGTAVAGAVATAIMQIARSLISNEEYLAGIPATSAKAIEVARGNLMNGRGVGHELVEAFLHDIPGVNKNLIKEQLAALKSSGHYERLMTEIATEAEITYGDEAVEVAELEKEAETAPTVKAKEAVERKLNKKRLHVARKTKKNVEKAKVTFDYDGVAKHLKNPYQIKAFRTVVTSAAVRGVLPFENQGALAKEIAREAAASNQELSGEYIRAMIGIKVGDAKFKATTATNKQLEEAFKTRVRE